MESYIISEDGLKSRTGSCTKYEFLDLELDDELVHCRSGLGVAGDITLYGAHDVPNYLQDNPYIIHGYRVSLSFKHCLKSMFMWNNESINIWSHLLGFMVFLVVMLYDNLVVIPSFGGTLLDHVIASLSLVCYQVCMLCSTGFHVFYCHSERACRRWLSVDLAGISVGVIGVYLPGVHYAFYCLSIWRDLYFIVIAVLSGAVLVVQLHPRYRTSAWFRHRLIVYSGLVAYGVIPTAHWVVLNGGLNSKLVQIVECYVFVHDPQVFVPKVMTMYLISIVAFFFYISKIPERFFPGQFDYIGWSHQWWHLGIVTAFLWWYQAGQEIIKYRLTHSCPS